MRLFNEGWEFAKNGQKDFMPVSIPHDWLIYDTRNLYETSVGYYRKKFDTGGFPGGSRVFITFDGVYMDSELFVNGMSAGVWKYGYTAFEFDITEHLHKGVNELLMKVNYESPNSRWYTGAGIYRDVFLSVKNAARFISDGIYITPRKQNDGTWLVDVSAEVSSSAKDMPHEIRHTVIGNDGGLTISKPKLWDINSPNLYHLKSELVVNGEITDRAITRFGLREIKFSPSEGFFLNGRNVKIQGVCQHHDLGALGAAVHVDALRRQMTLLGSMGVNAIRTAHNPPARAFMSLADEMGFLVMSELSDMWRLSKTKYDYARFFDEWVEKDLASWVRRDRNCPSVILWSVGNEIYDTHADYDIGAATLRNLKRLVEVHDPNTHAPVTLSSNYMPWENTQKCADIVKIIGYNYAEELYHKHHQAHPDWVIYGGETSSVVQSRGVYHFPLSREVLHDDDFQCSALGNSRVSWGARSAEACITDHRDAGFVFGQFLWTGTDYIGEPTPYHTKNSFFGQIDTAGFPKDSFYIYKSVWTSHKTDPFIHIFPYWDFSPGQLIDVRVCTNAPVGELFLNGNSLGKFETDHEVDTQIVKHYQIPYEKGTLTAIAYDESGREIARGIRRSFGDAASIGIHSHRIGALMFCEIVAYDNEGNPVENANNRVNISVIGGTLLGTDNGDSTDYDSYQSGSRRLFNGKLLAIVKPNGVEPVLVDACFDKTDIPIRKIELSVDGYNVTARTYPENATYSELIWRVTDEVGIDSPLATFSVEKNLRSGVLEARGDGLTYIRCAAKNGGRHIDIYSLYPITITGCGECLLLPYSFIAGGLYNKSNAEMGNGNERGVATLRDGASHVGFKNLDFGTYGADEFTMGLFPLSREPFTFEVWEGMPDEGGELIATLPYDKGSVWNTYIDVTYKLPRRIKGAATICFVFTQKVHIKGFVFTKPDKAFARHHAAENDGIYGDSYSINGQAVEKIGNNVTLVFSGMDFGEEGSGAVEISYRCAAKNSFQIVFADVNGQAVSSMLEATPQEEYSVGTFPLGMKATGLQTVSFVFLPGCEIDIEWIKFI